jgi:hypothetical protein
MVLCPFCGLVENCCFAASRVCVVCGVNIDHLAILAKSCGSQCRNSLKRIKTREKRGKPTCLICVSDISDYRTGTKLCGSSICHRKHQQQRKRQYYRNNHEIILEKWRQYQLNNRERIQKYRTQYLLNNHEKIKEWKHQFYVNNRERILESRRQHYLDNRERIRERWRQYRSNNRERFMERGRQYKLNNYERILERQRLRKIKNPKKIQAQQRLTSFKRRFARVVLNDPELRVLFGKKVSPRVILEVCRQLGIEIPLPKERKK